MGYASLAYKINTLIKESDDKDKFLILCGGPSPAEFGHCVPARIWEKNEELKKETYIVYTHSLMTESNYAKLATSSVEKFFGKAEDCVIDLCFGFNKFGRGCEQT